LHWFRQLCIGFLRQVTIGFRQVFPLLHIPAHTGIKKRLHGTEPAPSCLNRAIESGKNYLVNPATEERCVLGLTKEEAQDLLDWIDNHGFLVLELQFDEKTGYVVRFDIP
jgi:hypothetical protein